MTSALEQLKVAYEQEGMSPAEIAEDQGLDVIAVKSGLMQVSSKYRKACGREEVESEDGLNFTSDQLRRVNDRIYELAVTSEDEHIVAKMCTYIRDDIKGRKDVVKAVQHSGINVLMINNAIQAAREGAGKLKQIVTEQKAIEA